jgi:hypothetical protein
MSDNIVNAFIEAHLRVRHCFVDSFVGAHQRVRPHLDQGGHEYQGGHRGPPLLRIVASFSILLLCVARVSHGAEFFASIGESTDFDSNVYQDQTKESDFVFRPNLRLGADLGDIWTIGYDGNLAAYIKHPDLFYHRHEIYSSVNPAFGKDNEHEFFAELSALTQRNADEFSSVNLVQPSLLLMLAMEPLSWMRWSLSEQVAYRWFYDDTDMDSLDSFTRASVLFTAKTRTTIAPRFAFGYRGYPRLRQQRGQDASDLQIEAGIHLSQNVIENLGLQADWAYRHAFEAGVLIVRSMGLPSFSYIGEDFLFTGHTAMVGMKSVFQNGVSFGLEVAYAYKIYNGWLVLDDAGEATGGERVDNQLEPRGWFRYTYSPGDDASRAVPEVSVSVSYAYLRQWSDDAWYDTDRHIVRLGVDASW